MKSKWRPLVICFFILILSSLSTVRGGGPLPEFRFQKLSLHPDDLNQAPAGDLIYPTIIKTEERIKKPLVEYSNATRQPRVIVYATANVGDVASPEQPKGETREIKKNKPAAPSREQDKPATPGSSVDTLRGDGSDRVVQLLRDNQFAEGFGAAFIYGIEFSGGRRPPLGEVLAYRDISPWQVHLIPDGPVKKVGVKTHPWDFQEGLHHNFTDRNGRVVHELHAHRLVVNHKIEEDSQEELRFAQYNNDGLARDDPARDTKLVKRVTTDRRGTLRIYYNSKNELRNAAIAHSAKWARDTWPHFLVNQRFTEPIPLAEFHRLDFRVSFQVDRMNQLSGWPNRIRGAARSGMNLKFMFFLRGREDLDQKLFAGMMLFTSNKKHYAPHLGVEQHGNIFYRDSVTSKGEAAPELTERRSVTVSVRRLVEEALRQGRERQRKLSADPEDFAIYNFSIGFEGMGHWETEAEITGLSLTGHPDQGQKQQ